MMKVQPASLLACAAIVIAITTPIVSSAQGATPAGQRQGVQRQGGRGGGGLFLLMSSEVQKELKITPAQKVSIEKALGSMIPARRPAQGGTGTRPPQVGARPDFAAIEKKVLAVINASQKLRFEELKLQSSGANAFRRDEVAKKLGLTEKQKKAIEDILDKARPNFTRGAPGGQQDFEKLRKEMETKRAAGNKAAMAQLTPAQKATWAKMTGKPFTFPRPQMRAPGGGGRGGAPKS